VYFPGSFDIDVQQQNDRKGVLRSKNFTYKILFVKICTAIGKKINESKNDKTFNCKVTGANI
jgi:hypothetical protein